MSVAIPDEKNWFEVVVSGKVIGIIEETKKHQRKLIDSKASMELRLLLALLKVL